MDAETHEELVNMARENNEDFSGLVRRIVTSGLPLERRRLERLRRDRRAADLGVPPSLVPLVDLAARCVLEGGDTATAQQLVEGIHPLLGKQKVRKVVIAAFKAARRDNP